MIKEYLLHSSDPHVSDLNGVHACGEGWTGDEALYVAIFCALRYPNDFAAALRCAVNHGGDSDSTGAICGNILGAWLGREAVAQAFSLEHLELRDVIENIAADLYTAAVRGIPQGDLLWDSKYRRGGEMPVQPAQEERRWTDFLYTPMTRRALALVPMSRCSYSGFRKHLSAVRVQMSWVR